MEKPRHVMREAGLLLTFGSPSDAGLLYEVIPRSRFSIVPVRLIADHCARARPSGPCPRASARAGQFPGGVMATPLAVDPRRSCRYAMSVKRGALHAKTRSTQLSDERRFKISSLDRALSRVPSSVSRACGNSTGP